MAATAWVTRRHLRRRWMSVLPYFGVVVAGTAGTLVAVNAAYQTDTAYERYLERSDVGELVINPSIQTAQIDATIRGLPGVTAVTTDDLFYAGIGEYSSVDEALANSSDVTVRGSTDGRYVDQDRLVYRDGRPPTGNNEAVISVEAAALHDVELGDRLPLTFASIQDDIRAIYLGEQPTVGVLGVEHPTVVGIATFPDEVLPDGLYERGRVVVSADIASRYSCTPNELAQSATIEDIVDDLAPARCSTSYRYWSLSIDGGASATQPTLDALIAEFDARNAGLAPAMSEMGLAYVPIITTTSDEVARVARAMRPTVVALMMIAVAVAALTLVVSTLVLARTLHRDDVLHVRLNELGMPAGQRAIVSGIPAVAAAVIGGVVGWSIATVVPTGPIGAVEVLEQSRRGLQGWAWWMAMALVLVIALGAAVIARQVADSAIRSERRATERTARRSLVGLGRPTVAVGVGEAITWRRSSLLTWVISTTAFAAFVATIVFGTSLSHLVASPTAYGWPWDLANMTGSGYGGLSIDRVTDSLDDETRITGWTALGFTQGVSVDGIAIPPVIVYDSPTDADIVVTSGRLPRTADEVALGSRSAAERNVEIGDEVALDGDGLRHDRATVTGIVVLPAIGPYQADRATPGRGVLLADDAFESDFIEPMVSFVGINVEDGTDVDQLANDLDDDFWSWEFYDRPRPLKDSVRPPEIVNAGSIRSVPLLVGALVGVATVVGFGSSMLLTARARRRELAVLRTLGFSNRQLRRSLQVQSVLTALLTAGIGTVAGLVIGRLAWRLFATELGVVTNPRVPIVVPLAVMLLAALLGVVAAVAPGSYATRLRAGHALRAM